MLSRNSYFAILPDASPEKISAYGMKLFILSYV